MGFRATLSKPFAAYIARQQAHWISRPVETQLATLQYLLKKAKHTVFGANHGFADIRTPEQWAAQVPLRDYEGLRDYVDLVVEGKPNVLWPGRPVYYAKTSGTTSGVKYIPITADSIPYHIHSARNALLNYVHETGKSDFLDRKLIFLSGSPTLEDKKGVKLGRLSGIVNHHVPSYLRTNQLPAWETNIIEDWETKLDRIVEETLQQDMSLISGIPPWVQMYFDRIIARTGRPIKDVFPNFEMFVYGGVNFEPYRKKLYESIGRQVPSIETYPASEGFIAYQDRQEGEGLLLLLRNGMYYEFVPLEEFGKPNATRLHIGQVELGRQYAIILNTNAGLYGYVIGDTVKFVSKSPYRILVTGRIKHFISAFGEHVIGEEVEKAMRQTLEKHPGTMITEFTVAPYVSPDKGASYHEWLVAFARQPQNPTAFAADLDQAMRGLNVYYDDLISGNILRPLVLTALQPDAFQQYMKSVGKLGGQNKVPRLSNDRQIATPLHQWKLS